MPHNLHSYHKFKARSLILRTIARSFHRTSCFCFTGKESKKLEDENNNYTEKKNNKPENQTASGESKDLFHQILQTLR